ncbi:hypothetical protein [Thermaurantiacus sp.]
MPGPSDPCDLHFLAEAHRQGEAVAASATEADDQTFVDSITEWPAH